MIVNKTKGRPRSAPKWSSTMRFNILVDYASNKDVHTALHLAGTESSDLIHQALREYIVNHNLPAGSPEVQANAALSALGVPAFTPSGLLPHLGREPAPTITATAPTPIESAPPCAVKKPPEPMAPSPLPVVSIAVPAWNVPPPPVQELPMLEVDPGLLDFARSQMDNS